MANILNKVKGFFSKVGAFCVKIWAKIVEFFAMVGSFFAKLWNKAVELFKEKTKNVKWKEVWDKCTTGILILIFASPILVLGYIFLWFLMR
ncbi:MAG: hypothetical protein J6Q85_08180 [Clostridia bacterium]|nr:hypothetical protein [Clostridia bacterium]